MPMLFMVPPSLGVPEAVATSGAGGSLETLLLAFSVFAALALGWLLFHMTRERFTFETVLCPRRDRVATVVFRRTWDGRLLDVASCSLLGKGARIDCGRQCMRDGPPGRRPAQHPGLGARSVTRSAASSA